MKLSNNQIFRILLKSQPFLTKKDIDSFLRITSYKAKENKEIIIQKGCSSKKAFFILKGAVKGYLTDKDETENIILLRGEGYFVGDAKKLFKDDFQRYTYEAIQKTHILFFDYSDFEALVNQNPNIMKWLGNLLKEIIIMQNYRIETFISMTAKERYLSLIEINPNFLEKVYAKYIADFLGITPVSLSRIINNLENKIKE